MVGAGAHSHGAAGMAATREPPDEVIRTIQACLASTSPESLRHGLALVEHEISRLGSKEARPLFEVLSSISYLDPLDRPELVPALDEAVSLVVGVRERVIPADRKRSLRSRTPRCRRPTPSRSRRKGGFRCTCPCGRSSLAS